MRVLLISLGTGPSVEHGIAYSIRTHNPDRLIYFATEQSLPTKDKIEALLSTPAPPSEIVRLADGDDPDEIYRRACDILTRLKREGVKLAEEVFADFTSGTKAMSAGLFAAALAQGIRNLSYVSGQRGPDGRVISGTERTITFVPAEMLADRLRRQIMELFNGRLFGAALQLAERGLREIHTPQRRQELEELQKLCQAYQAWDWFDHRSAAQHFAQIDKRVIARWSERIARNKGWVHQIANELRPKAPTTERYNEKLLIDLWLNAERRMEEGHWVDAVARLYRLVELIAQFRLAHGHGLDAGALEVGKLPEHLQSKYETLRDEQGRVKLGLQQAYQLLADVNDPVGNRYGERLQGALRTRNESIGGHGLQPVTNEGCAQLAELVRSLLDEIVPGWESLAPNGRFAQLEL